MRLGGVLLRGVGVGWGSNGSRSTRDTVVQRGVLNLEHLTQILTDSQWFSRKFVVCIWFKTPGQY